MRKRDYRDYLDDILNSIDEVASFIKGATYEDFLNDKKTLNAVIRSIEVLGEASKHIPKTIRDKYPSIPWKKMTGIRDKVIHEYFGIDYDIVWKTAHHVLPALRDKLIDLIKNERLH